MKDILFNLCQEYFKNRIEATTAAIAAAQSSANEETKSSAGDKYETGRAMAQLEIEKLTIQLREFLKARQVLDALDLSRKNNKAGIGSLVSTKHGIFFIAVSAGQFTVGDTKVMAISPAAPIAQKMIGLMVGESFTFLNNNYTIESLE